MQPVLRERTILKSMLTREISYLKGSRRKTSVCLTISEGFFFLIVFFIFLMNYQIKQFEGKHYIPLLSFKGLFKSI